MYEEKFINPYNFINLPEGKKTTREEFIKDHEKLTGYINITLKVRNAIIIPDYQEGTHPTYGYYHYPNTKAPVIPGSQVRGVIRNVYETITNSCISKINDMDYNLNRRVSAPFKPIILKYEYGSWYLYLATRYKVDKFLECDDLKDFDKVYFRTTTKKGGIYKIVTEINRNPNGNGIYHINENKADNGNDKPKRSVFIYKNVNEKVKIKDEDIDRLKEVIKIHQKYDEPNKTFNRILDVLDHKNGINEIPLFAHGDCVEDENGYAQLNYNYEHLYLSPSCLGRKLSYKKLEELYKGFEPCKSKEHLCPACSLFGYMGKKDSTTSKVKFLDLIMTEDSDYIAKNVRQFINGGPNICNSNFYATNLYRNYYNNDKNNKDGLDWDDYGVQISGRKFYWHSDTLNDSSEFIRANKDISKDVISRYTPIERKDNHKLEFKGKVYFKNITETELNYLILALNLNENTPADGKNFRYYHKIGHSKAFGFGSVKITCDSLFFKNKVSVDNLSVSSTESDIYQYMKGWNDNLKYIKQLKIITDINSTRGKTVSYPYVINKYDGERNYDSRLWFSTPANKKLKLPGISSPIEELVANITKK